MKLSRTLLPVKVNSTRTRAEVRFEAERARRFAEVEALIVARESHRWASLHDVPDDDLQRRATASHRAARRTEQLEAMARRAETRREAQTGGVAPAPRRALGWRPSLAAHLPRTARSVDPGPV